MADVGLLPEGFVPALAADIRTEMEDEMREEFGESFPLGDGTFAGHTIGILSERLGLLWEIAQISFSSFDPDANSGASQRAIGAITGTFEIPEAASIATETLCGDDGTVVPAGSVISTASTGKRFATTVDATIDALDAWTALTTYADGDRVTNSDRCYECIAAGISDVSGGPTTTDPDITDGTAHWVYLGEGTAAVDVTAASEEIGEIVAAAGDLTEIETPLGGWNTARNLEDAELGRLEQTDESFRLLREQELAAPGSGPPDAIRAALLQIVGVTTATVFFNNTDETDGDGLPPHSCECLVDGGDDQDIWDVLWDNVPVGIQTIGDEEGFVTDDEGIEQVLRFSRPEVLDIYINVSLTMVEEDYGGDATIEDAIVAFGDSQKTGKDAVASAISAQCFRVNGVLDVTELLLYTDAIGAAVAWAPTTGYVATVGARDVVTNDGGRKYICITGGTSAGSGGPTGTGTDITDGTVHWRFLGATIPVSRRQFADYDTGRIDITSVAGDP